MDILTQDITNLNLVVSLLNEVLRRNMVADTDVLINAKWDILRCLEKLQQQDDDLEKQREATLERWEDFKSKRNL